MTTASIGQSGALARAPPDRETAWSVNVEQRTQGIAGYLRDNLSASKLCAPYGVRRKGGYKRIAPAASQTGQKRAPSRTTLLLFRRLSSLHDDDRDAAIAVRSFPAVLGRSPRYVAKGENVFKASRHARLRFRR